MFASLYEGFGLPPLEAMTMGTPVIAMPISAIPEVGGDAILYPDGLSAAALSRAMERLATDEVLREDLREKGYARAQNFLWEKSARDSIGAYRAALLRPSERSLRMRRLLHDVIIDWSQKMGHQPVDGVGQVLGIRDACRVLDLALRNRMRRELRRFHAVSTQRWRG